MQKFKTWMEEIGGKFANVHQTSTVDRRMQMLGTAFNNNQQNMNMRRKVNAILQNLQALGFSNPQETMMALRYAIAEVRKGSLYTPQIDPLVQQGQGAMGSSPSTGQ